MLNVTNWLQRGPTIGKETRAGRGQGLKPYPKNTVLSKEFRSPLISESHVSGPAFEKAEALLRRCRSAVIPDSVAKLIAAGFCRIALNQIGCKNLTLHQPVNLEFETVHCQCLLSCNHSTDAHLLRRFGLLRGWLVAWHRLVQDKRW